jgi:iron-sulfur cluster insertion protein
MNQITISESALSRILEIQNNPNNANKFLRISVSGGGCSGFQYVLELDDKIKEDDIEISKNNDKIIAITDEVSLPFLEGSQVEFIKELGASYFKVQNPNAKASCGCGSSFSV